MTAMNTFSLSQLVTDRSRKVETGSGGVLIVRNCVFDRICWTDCN